MHGKKKKRFICNSFSKCSCFSTLKLQQIRNVKTNEIVQEIYECSSTSSSASVDGISREIWTNDQHFLMEFCECKSDKYVNRFEKFLFNFQHCNNFKFQMYLQR